MAGSNFVDYVKIFARSGHGGSGDTRHDLFRTGIYRCKDSASREECQIYLDTSEAESLQNAVENRKQGRFIENSGGRKPSCQYYKWFK